jgi:hypothetical protein
MEIRRTNKTDGNSIRGKRVKDIEVRIFITQFLLNFSRALYCCSVFERYIMNIRVYLHIYRCQHIMYKYM